MRGSGDLLVAFVGDSFTAGTALGGQNERGWPALLSAEMGWRYAVHAMGGTGYVNEVGGITFASHVGAVAEQRPDLVILAGSVNDFGRVDEAAFARTMASYAELPSVRQTVVIGPLSFDTSRWVSEIAAAVANAATSTGCAHVDSSSWLVGQPPGQDGIHPDDTAHTIIADRVTAALRLLLVG